MSKNKQYISEIPANSFELIILQTKILNYLANGLNMGNYSIDKYHNLLSVKYTYSS